VGIGTGKYKITVGLVLFITEKGTPENGPVKKPGACRALYNALAPERGFNCG
jgi:hypothetical protein